MLEQNKEPKIRFWTPELSRRCLGDVLEKRKFHLLSKKTHPHNLFFIFPKHAFKTRYEINRNILQQILRSKCIHSQMLWWVLLEPDKLRYCGLWSVFSIGGTQGPHLILRKSTIVIDPRWRLQAFLQPHVFTQVHSIHFSGSAIRRLKPLPALTLLEMHNNNLNEQIAVVTPSVVPYNKCGFHVFY